MIEMQIGCTLWLDSTHIPEGIWNILYELCMKYSEIHAEKHTYRHYGPKQITNERKQAKDEAKISSKRLWEWNLTVTVFSGNVSMAEQKLAWFLFLRVFFSSLFPPT